MLDSELTHQINKSLPQFRQNAEQIVAQICIEILHADKTLSSLCATELLNLEGPDVPNSDGELQPYIDCICAKSHSRGIEHHHYDILTRAFSKSIRHVIGNAASHLQFAAWDEAVQLLAEMVVKKEKKLLARMETSPGYWKGFRKFQVAKQEIPMHNSVALLLFPADGQEIIGYTSGQYVCLRIETESHGTIHKHIMLAAQDARYSEKQAPKYYKLWLHQSDSQEMIILDSIHHLRQVFLSVPVGGFVATKAIGGTVNALLRAAIMGNMKRRMGNAEITAEELKGRERLHGQQAVVFDDGSTTKQCDVRGSKTIVGKAGNETASKLGGKGRVKRRALGELTNHAACQT